MRCKKSRKIIVVESVVAIAEGRAAIPALLHGLLLFWFLPLHGKTRRSFPPKGHCSRPVIEFVVRVANMFVLCVREIE